MNKMESLRAGAAEMRSLARRLTEWADELDPPFRDQASDAPEVPASEPVQPGQGRKKAKKTLTLPEVRSILAGKCAAGFGTQVKALIESYGAVSLKDVPAEKYEELLEAAEHLGEPLSTASGGNLERGEITRNKRAPQCGVAPIEGAGPEVDADAG